MLFLILLVKCEVTEYKYLNW